MSIFVEHATDDTFSILVPGHSYFLEANEESAREKLRTDLGCRCWKNILPRATWAASRNPLGAPFSGCEACEQTPSQILPV